MSFVLQRASFDPMIVSWIGTAIAVSYAAYLTYTTSKRSVSGGAGGAQINPGVKKDTPKVVDNVDVEDLGKKAVFCRCWRSKKFPYCDGAHAKHNEATGDNVGPLIIQNSNGPK
jgi:CDGSH-type Zn-finger protein